MKIIMPQFILPCQYPIGAKFGDVNLKLWKTQHWGTDFVCPLDTPLRAIADGTVTYSRKGDPDLGTWIGVSRQDGWYYSFGHLNEVLVPEGSRVHAGQVIALSGNTGHSTGPHVHLTVRNPKGERVPPQFVKTPFADVGPEDKRFALFVKASERGIAKGQSDKALGVDTPITRGDALVLVMRALEAMEVSNE